MRKCNLDQTENVRTESEDTRKYHFDVVFTIQLRNYFELQPSTTSGVEPISKQIDRGGLAQPERNETFRSGNFNYVSNCI